MKLLIIMFSAGFMLSSCQGSSKKPQTPPPKNDTANADRLDQQGQDLPEREDDGIEDRERKLEDQRNRNRDSLPKIQPQQPKLDGGGGGSSMLLQMGMGLLPGLLQCMQGSCSFGGILSGLAGSFMGGGAGGGLGGGLGGISGLLGGPGGGLGGGAGLGGGGLGGLGDGSNLQQPQNGAPGSYDSVQPGGY